MPSSLPSINISMPQDLYDAICREAGGKQKMSAYLRNLAARELNIPVEMKHGKKSKLVKE